jgi:serine/threonine protein kinase
LKCETAFSEEPWEDTFQEIEVLGAGNFGSVKKGQSKATGKLVAIKVRNCCVLLLENTSISLQSISVLSITIDMAY